MAAEFFRVWLTFSLMILGAAVLAAVWAARAGHFRDQERARNLALWAQVEESPSPGLRPPSPQGRGESNLRQE